MGGHENYALTDLGVVLLVVGLGVGDQLNEVVIDPLPALHFVGLLEVNDTFLALVPSC